jgi:hypothetical protein
MSFILNSSGLKVSSNTGKVLFDSDRPTPHIVSVVSGTITSGILEGNTYLTGIVDQQPREFACQCQRWQTNDFYSAFYTTDKTFFIPYYRVSLPVSNNRLGAYAVGETNGSWVSANGGLLLRAYSSREAVSYPSFVGAFQGVQFVHAYVPQNGTMRVSVSTSIFGQYGFGDAIAPAYIPGPMAPQPIPHTAYTVDYKIFIGTT